MARTSFALVIMVAVAIGFLFATYLNRPIHAQEQGRDGRFWVTPVGVLDGQTGRVRAAFLRDNKTGECWLWVKDGEASTLAPATESACH